MQCKQSIAQGLEQLGPLLLFVYFNYKSLIKKGNAGLIEVHRSDVSLTIFAFEINYPVGGQVWTGHWTIFPT